MSIRFIAYSFDSFNKRRFCLNFTTKRFASFIRHGPTTNRPIEGLTADGGGYILAASHTILPETPDENVFALFAEAGVRKEEIYDTAAKIRRAM